MFFEMVGTVVIVLEAICCFLFFDVFQPQRIEYTDSFRRISAIVCLSVFLILISFLFSWDFLLRQGVGIICISLTMILIMGYGYLQAFVMAFLFLGFLNAIEYIGFLVLEMWVVDTQNLSGVEAFAALNITLLTLVIMLTSIILVRRIFRKNHNEALFRKEWLKFIAFPLFTNIVLLMMTSAFDKSTNDVQAYVLLIIGVGLVIMNFYVFYLLDDTIKTHRGIKSEALYEMQKKDRMEMYTALYTSLERQRSESHDFRNHIMCLKSLADNEDMKSIKEYIKSICDSGIMAENIVDTHHVIINSIINTKYYEATTKQIAVVMKLSDLSQVHIQNDDLVVLISNLLNNAIEATEQCKEKRYIYLKTVYNEEGLLLSVKNPYVHSPKKNGDEYISSKDNRFDNHGIGLKNVKKVVEKYNGMMSIEDKDNFFSVTVLIPVETCGEE